MCPYPSINKLWMVVGLSLEGSSCLHPRDSTAGLCEVHVQSAPSRANWAFEGIFGVQLQSPCQGACVKPAGTWTSGCRGWVRSALAWLPIPQSRYLTGACVP